MSNPQTLLFATFEVLTVKDEGASRTKGRPIFKDVEHVRIRFAGDPKRVLVAPADQPCKRDKSTNEWLTYAEIYSEQYRKFKASQDQMTVGTPLSEVPFLTEAKRAELRALNIHNLEALADLEGQPLKVLGMGGRDLKNMARALIESAEGSADVVALKTENAAMHDRVDELQKQIEELIAAKKDTPKEDQPAPAEEYDPSASPFFDWEDDDIVAFIVENGGEKPHPNCKHETVVQKADELNARLKAQEAA